MRFDGFSRRAPLVALCAAATAFFLAAPSLRAEGPDDLAKQIEKSLSSIKRSIVTEPTRAEQDFVAARDMLARLKTSASGHAKLAALEKSLADLEVQLAKRLGRPVGGEPQPATKEPVPAGKPDVPSALPSAATSRLAKIEAALDAALAALEKSQLQTATRKLGEAQKVMDEIKQRYSSQIPAGSREMAAAEARLKQVGDEVSAASAAAAANAAADAAVREARESQSREWIDQFSPFFDYKSNLYLRMGAEFNSASDEEEEQTRKAYDRANELMQAYEKTEFPHGKTQDLAYLEQRLDGYLTIYNEQETRARQEEACREWVEAFRAYVEVGAGSKKCLVAGATVDESEINRMAELLEEAKAGFAEYQKAEFPLGKSPELIDLEKEMQDRLAQMPEAIRQSRALVSGNLEKEFERVLSYLRADTGWREDHSKSPNIVMERDIAPLKQALERYGSTVPAGDAKLAALRAGLTEIAEQDAKNRTVRAERTYMQPDRYDGDDADGLRETAIEIVKAKFAKAASLRTTLPAEEWMEESVVEWTDTTRTELRHRITRFMTAQVAAKDADGKVYLHSVHVASNRKADGSWSALQGHVMWSDWMAAENVEKDAPAR